MKFTTRSLTCFAALGILLLCSCVHNDTQTEEPAPTTADLIAKAAADPVPEAPKPVQLPVRYQNAGYVTADDTKVDEEFGSDEEAVIKVGANIRSTRGPQPLWDIMKRLASLKGMSVSWASDVDQNVLVDVDISATDNYYDAINNLLRQVDYFHEVEGTTLVVKYKETKTYHVAMPFTHQMYETATGGNVLGSADDTSSVEGTIRLDSKQNEFDIWKNIQENMDALIATWSTQTTSAQPAAAAPAAGSTTGTAAATETAAAPMATRRMSSGGNTYTIDKPVGLITVNAPRPLQERIELYLNNVKRELFKQVTIEAKIIEVQLNDSSTLGIDWHLLLSSLSFGGSLSVGKNYSKSREDDSSTSSDWSNSSSRTTSATNTTDRTNSVDNSLASDFSTGSTTDGTTGDVTYNDGTQNNTGDASTGYTSDSSYSTSDASENILSSAASAATTAATIITNGASNAASGALSLSTFNFTDFLHALSEQGNTSILANPKLSVMNGQPALITVGRNVTYIDKIESDVTSGTTVTTNYTVDTQRILSGVGLSITPVIKDNNEVVMNLVPVTSLLEEPIEYRQVGLGEVGLPIVNVREMSSMVQVHDGEMLVIGGLITSSESSEGQNLFPGLADVPVLKYLTGYETKSMAKRELIILLRPRIL